MDSLSSALKHFRAGDTAELHIWRDGEAMTLPIVFDTRPQGVLTPEIPPTEESEPTDADEEPTEDGGDFEWTFPWNFLP